MKTENSFLLQKLKFAIKKKFEDVKKNDYGVADENNVVNIIHQSITRKRTRSDLTHRNSPLGKVVSKRED